MERAPQASQGTWVEGCPADHLGFCRETAEVLSRCGLAKVCRALVPQHLSHVPSTKVREISLQLLNGEIFYTSDTSHQHQSCSCLPSPRGRLRYTDRIREPRWRNGQP